MPKTSFVVTAIVLYWLYLWRTHRKGGNPTLAAQAGTTAPSGAPLANLPSVSPGRVPVLPSIYSNGLPFGTPGINGGYLP